MYHNKNIWHRTSLQWFQRQEKGSLLNKQQRPKFPSDGFIVVRQLPAKIRLEAQPPPATDSDAICRYSFPDAFRLFMFGPTRRVKCGITRSPPNVGLRCQHTKRSLPLLTQRYHERKLTANLTQQPLVCGLLYRFCHFVPSWMQSIILKNDRK